MEIVIKASTLDEAKRILAALPFLLNPKVKDTYDEWLTDWDVYGEKTVYHIIDGIISKYGNVEWTEKINGIISKDGNIEWAENIRVVTLNEYLAEINHPWLKIGETT